MSDFGTDLGGTGQLVTGGENLIQALTRRIQTPRGSLFYDPGYGSTLHEWLGEGIQDDGLEVAVTLEIDLEEDPRVRSASVTVEQVTLRSIRLVAAVDTAAGPFELVVAGELAAAAVYPNVEVNARGHDL
ncbi:hypothetical protein [Deinococcus arenicola]|uniref:IraD/Gp25-like domain-containing protein n=1 Tax=Deinococcus arenicola TaxID=2994950 RepID=A0ABU4DV98_9DEIO|nr:hypothetical protein [Deinococcus sp. ZS9-10]MDV6376362.1 hypothetical protein [Deinococcus sp. ZS9-10]